MHRKNFRFIRYFFILNKKIISILLIEVKQRFQIAKFSSIASACTYCTRSLQFENKHYLTKLFMYNNGYKKQNHNKRNQNKYITSLSQEPKV